MKVNLSGKKICVFPYKIEFMVLITFHYPIIRVNDKDEISELFSF